MARIQQDRSAMMSALRPDALPKDGDGVSGYPGSGCREDLPMLLRVPSCCNPRG
jgi:hypothetical protein